MSIKAWAAREPHGPLAPFQYEPDRLGPWDVELAISHCGLCHSDLHLINDEWGISRYPLVPGHEIIGTVRALGAAVEHLQVGERVGVGWQRSACLACEDCARGEENLCEHARATCVGHPGGFAERIVTDSRFAFPIPAALSPAAAAPLLCAGITVYAPLRRYRIGPGVRLGVLGIGGLGHLALRFATALGAQVTALSSSPRKAADARRFGAQHFLDMNDAGARQRARRSLDFILSTVSADLDWAEVLALLRANGRLCFVGVPPAAIGLRAAQLIDGQKSLSGSAIGGRAMMREMLEFAARHGIEPQIERLPMAEVNTAVARVAANQARYRMVLENPA